MEDPGLFHGAGGLDSKAGRHGKARQVSSGRLIHKLSVNIMNLLFSCEFHRFLKNAQLIIIVNMFMRICILRIS